MSRIITIAMPKKFGEELKKLRRAKGLEVTELAEMSKLSKQTIHKIERGDTESPGIATLRKLSTGLGVDYQELVRLAEEEETAPGQVEERQPRPHENVADETLQLLNIAEALPPDLRGALSLAAAQMLKTRRPARLDVYGDVRFFPPKPSDPDLFKRRMADLERSMAMLSDDMQMAVIACARGLVDLDVWPERFAEELWRQSQIQALDTQGEETT